jgi:nicotinamide-nucleotide amidase
MWPTALASGPVKALLADVPAAAGRQLRYYGLSEAEVAATLRALERERDLSAVEVTTCLRRSELEVDLRPQPGGEDAAEWLAAELAARHAALLISADGTSTDELLARALLGRGWTVATAESCTGGLLAGRLTELAGSSDYVLGGLVVYANEAKVALAGVDPGLIERHGAVSTEVAEALAEGAREGLGADVGVGITGIAGPGGGSEDKPVGTVCFSVSDGSRRLTRKVHLPGARFDVRDRSTTVGMHLIRRLLRGEGAPSGG